MKNTTIYPDRSQELLALFEQAGNGKNLMCVAMDYAKKDHLVMLCNGHGRVLQKPFAVQNSMDGLLRLLERVDACCRRSSIAPEHVFFGGEDVNSYAENFVHALRTKGRLVASVNAHDAKKQRENLQASTDRIDLVGIAAMLLNRRATCSAPQSGIYRNLRTLVRHRRTLVKTKTEVSNRIHTVVDRLLPGFLDERKSGITPFSNSSLYLMQQRFSAGQIHRRRRGALVDKLQQLGTRKAEQAAARLQEHAGQVLKAADDDTASLQISLSAHVAHYRCLQDGAEQLAQQIALLLARTPAAFLTSISGIGIWLASAVISEIGDPLAQGPTDKLVSYGGIIPKVKQTGGTQGAVVTGRVSKRNNHRLKDAVVQSAFHIGRYGPLDLHSDYARRQAAGQHANFGMARRFIRISVALMRTSQVYLPPELRTAHCASQRRAEYYLSIWPWLKNKWRKAGALNAAFADNAPLGQWRHIVQELYGIKLKL